MNLTLRTLFYYMVGYLMLTSCTGSDPAAGEFPFQTILTDTISFNTDTLTLTDSKFLVSTPVTSKGNALLDNNELLSLELTDITYLFQPTDLVFGNSSVAADLRYGLPDSTFNRSRPLGKIANLFDNPLQSKQLSPDTGFEPNRLEDIFIDRRRFRLFLQGTVNNPPVEGNLVINFHWKGVQTRL